MIGSSIKVDSPATENKSVSLSKFSNSRQFGLTNGGAFKVPAAPFPFARIYRAHIAADSYGNERTAFVEALSHHGAIRKIANAVAALEQRLPDYVESRIYNCWSAAELIEDGMSDDIELRLFETGSGDRAISYVEDPLFLVASPALIRRWATIEGVRS